MQTIDPITEAIKAFFNNSAVPAGTEEENRAMEIPAATLSWSEAELAMIQVFVANGTIARRVVREGTCTYTALKPHGWRPTSLSILYTAVVPDGIKLFRVTPEGLDECERDTAIPFEVGVEWHGNMPRLQKGKHDVNFVFFRSDGRMVQLEVFVVVRGTQFYFGIQEGWRGAFVKTQTGANFYPAAPMNAYPGVNYQQSAVGGKFVLDLAVKRKFVRAFTELPQKATWPESKPTIPDNMLDAGWEPAMVKWFNASGGYGQVILAESGETAYVHMKCLLDASNKPALREDNFPLLQPCETVAVKVAPGDKGLVAKVCRRLK